MYVCMYVYMHVCNSTSLCVCVYVYACINRRGYMRRCWRDRAIQHLEAQNNIHTIKECASQCQLSSCVWTILPASKGYTYIHVYKHRTYILCMSVRMWCAYIYIYIYIYVYIYIHIHTYIHVCEHIRSRGMHSQLSPLDPEVGALDSELKLSAVCVSCVSQFMQACMHVYVCLYVGRLGMCTCMTCSYLSADIYTHVWYIHI